MKENVGGIDRGIRSLVGPALMAVGYTLLGGRKGRISGLLALVAGALFSESAITKTCPLNQALGVNTARLDSSFPVE